MLPLASVSSCSDDLTPDDSPAIGGKGTGEMVRFTVGTTNNSLTSRATDAKTYYMPDASRFVCRMYYKAQTGSNEFDVTGGTDHTTWFKVSGSVGNSLYWNRDYTDVADSKGKGGVDEYGNDYSATAFYWQNRKEHAFLAWTDLNRATKMTGGHNQGQLKFESDDIYKTYTSDKVTKFVTKYYKIYGIDREFGSIAEMQQYMLTVSGDKTIGETDEFRAKQEELRTENGWDWTTDAARNSYRYEHGWQYKYSALHNETEYIDGTDESDATKRELSWVQYVMYFEKITIDVGDLEQYIKVPDPKNPNVVIFLKNKDTGRYVAAAEAQKDSEGRYVDSDNQPTDDPSKYAYKYYETDEDGNLRYNENNPRYTFYYMEHDEKENTDVVVEHPVLAFDLTRSPEMESMADQPDIVQAKAIQAPTGATQESNRVNLYFKHQFSQIQVNIRNADDNSVTLAAADVLGVELLGVTKTGYVFTELSADGKVRDAAYADINFKEYNEQQLNDNPYGTSFDMFDMGEENYALNYLKSFNAIAFGQLQAIRIKWRESGNGNKIHKATFRIPETDLINLKSGVRYIWNMEVRRGTLAVIRTEVVDWELADDEAHNGSADGIIQN